MKIKIRALLIVILSVTCLFAGGEEANPDPNLMAAKLYAARGIQHSLIAEYKREVSPNKRLLVVHSHGSYHTRWLFWILEVEGKIKLGAFSPGRENTPEWLSKTLQANSEKGKLIIDLFSKFEAPLTQKESLSENSTIMDSAYILECYYAKGAVDPKEMVFDDQVKANKDSEKSILNLTESLFKELSEHAEATFKR